MCTDTRAIERGDLFVALKGENHDAQLFLAEAVAKGAAAVVVEDARRAQSIGVPVYVVANTLHALANSLSARRLAWGGPLVAVGGSNGKTSTKELIRAALGARLETHATKGNLNNQVGVPLTLLAIPDGADVVVVELGTNVPGEIALLRGIVEPTIAVMTTVQEEHLEGFGDLAGVMREEASLLDGVANAIVPADEPALVSGIGAPRAPHGHCRRWKRRYDGRGVRSLSPDGTGVDVVEGSRSTCRSAASTICAMPCSHSRSRANAAIMIERRRRGGRGQWIRPRPCHPCAPPIQPLGEALLINDAYNSNPARHAPRSRCSSRSVPGTSAWRFSARCANSALRPLARTADVAREAMHSGATIVAGIGEFAAALRKLRRTTSAS